MVKSRAARIRLASTPDAGAAISGKQAQRTGVASGPGAPPPLARAAISAAGISQCQPSLPAALTICAVIPLDVRSLTGHGQGGPGAPGAVPGRPDGPSPAGGLG